MHTRWCLDSYKSKLFTRHWSPSCPYIFYSLSCQTLDDFALINWTIKWYKTHIAVRFLHKTIFVNSLKSPLPGNKNADWFPRRFYCVMSLDFWCPGFHRSKASCSPPWTLLMYLLCCLAPAASVFWSVHRTHGYHLEMHIKFSFRSQGGEIKWQFSTARTFTSKLLLYSPQISITNPDRSVAAYPQHLQIVVFESDPQSMFTEPI